MTRLLIVDDDANLRHTLGYALRQEGFEVVTAEDGERGLESFRQARPDVVVLDVMLPRLDGFEVCRRIRRESDVPVIMLTARDTEMDKVVGLEIGADDYLGKPFSTRELVARVRAMVRRTRRAEPVRGERLVAGGLALDPGRHRVTLDDHEVALVEGIDENARTTRLFGNVYAEYDWMPGLTARLNVGTDRFNVRHDTYESRHTINGAAAGGGASLSLACDLRIAGESARMNAAFIRIGLSACDVGVSYFLPRMVGSSIAAELLLTGNFIDAARAERTGLVSRVVPDAELETTAHALAADILRNSPLGVRLTKECLQHSIDAGSLEQAIAMEDRNQILCAQTTDVREGIIAFLEKRPPRYEDR